MSENKIILKYCPNFYRIINFNPVKEDQITAHLIEVYQNYIFTIDIHDEEQVNTIKELDSALIKYINDYNFRKEVQKQIPIVYESNNYNIIKLIINKILQIFSNYDEYTTRIIYISRWI